MAVLVQKTFSTVCTGQLHQAITDNVTIVTVLEQIVYAGGATTDFWFANALSGPENTELDNILGSWSCAAEPVETGDGILDDSNGPSTDILWSSDKITNDFVEIAGDDMTGDLKIQTEVRVKHPSDSNQDIIIQSGTGYSTIGSSISKPGTSGFLHMMPNSANVQWLIGNPASATGVNMFYWDVDEEGVMFLNTLPGAGRTGDVVATHTAALRPGADLLSTLGTASFRWGTIYGQHVDLTGNITTTGTVDGRDVSTDGSTLDTHVALTNEHLDWTADQGANNIHDNNIVASSITQHVASIDHDQLLNFVTNEHLDWTADQGANNIHDNNIVASSVTQHVGSIDHNSLLNTHNLTTDIDHDQLTNYAANEHASPKNSIEIDTGQLQLVNDTASPGNTKLYGTNGSGVLGWYDQPAGASGEINTASNLGAGVGVFDGKVGVDLQFRSLVSQNTLLSITLDGVNDEIDFTVNEGNIDHDGLLNYAANEHASPKNSIEIDIGQLQLDGDQTSPGNNMRYGTDGSGNKGWYAAGLGTGDVTAAANLTDHSLVRGDGGSKGVQDTDQWTVADNGAMQGIVSTIADGTPILMLRHNGASFRSLLEMKNAAGNDVFDFRLDGSQDPIFRVYDGTNYILTATSGGVGVNKITAAAALDVVGNIEVTGTVDGRDVALDGTNQDTHIADGTIHYTQASISITESQISDLGNYAVIGGAHHDGFSDFVANEHINHTSVTLTAGAGLAGGGDISANRTFSVNVQNSIEISTDTLQLVNDAASPGNNQVYGTNGAGVKGWKADPAGGGGDVVGPASATDHAIARYDTTTGKLIQDSTVIVDDTGGVTGLQTITPALNVTWNLGSAGLYWNWIYGLRLITKDGTAAQPAHSFGSSPGTGMWTSAANVLDFATGTTNRFQIEADGTLNVQTANYETLVTADDDIPNKKYVDDAITAAGGGDVSAAANIVDNSIVRGDGGVKGVQDSEQGTTTWTIADNGKLVGVGDNSGDYIMTIRNLNATTGNGFSVQAGEALGDLAFSIQDSDGSFIIMECEADQGYVTFGNSYAQTLIDNGVVYGIDNQNSGSNAGDFNAQSGTYRIAGVDVVVPTGGTVGQVLEKASGTNYDMQWADPSGGSAALQIYTFFADQVEYPRTGSDWNFTNGAPASRDTNNSSMTVRRFDDTTQEGVGFWVRVPAGATNMTIRYKTRAETGSAAVAAPQLSRRVIPDNGAIGGWNNSTLTLINTTADERWQVDSATNTLTNWSMTAGETHQMEFSRFPGHASDNLSGDLTLLMIEVEFT